MKKHLLLLFTTATLVIVAGCPDDTTESDAGTSPEDDGGAPLPSDGGSTPNDGGTSGEDAGEEELDTTRDPNCTEGNWLVQLKGTVEDESGQGVEGAKVQVCVRTSPDENLFCLQPGTSESDGSFTNTFPEIARCIKGATNRTFVPLADKTTSYCKVDLSVDEPILELESPYVVFSTSRATSLPTLGAGNEVHTVKFEDGLEIDVIPEQFGIGYETHYSALAAVSLPPTTTGICMNGADAVGFLGFYGFSPEVNVQGTPFSIRIPASSEQSAGNQIDIYALGGLICKKENDELIEEGKWEKIGTGTVSTDGQFIEATGSNGLPCFTFLGFATAN